VPAHERAGLAFARNVGAAASTAEIVAFCDADDIVKPQWLQEILAPFDATERVMVGGALEFATLNSEQVRFWRGYEERMTGLVVGFNYLPHAIGANFAIRRADFLALGGCDEQFVGSSDEIDLCWRAQLAGITLVFAPEAVISYRLRESIRDTMRQQRGYGRSAAGLYRVHRDRMPPRSVGAVVAPYWLLLTRVHQLVRGARMRGRWLTMAAYWTGRIQGSVEQRVWFG
jgi:GT2 family glycosyltransferase